MVWVAASRPDAPMPVAMSVPVEVLFGHQDRFAVRALPGASVPFAAGTQVVTEGREGSFMPLFPGRPLVVAGSKPSSTAPARGEQDHEGAAAS
jgi:hypothetical protein